MIHSQRAGSIAYIRNIDVLRFQIEMLSMINMLWPSIKFSVMYEGNHVDPYKLQAAFVVMVYSDIKMTMIVPSPTNNARHAYSGDKGL